MEPNTIEKLIVQIFDRKREIIQQVNHQRHLYRQHYLSKLAIQGISPPPFLLNSDFRSSTSDFNHLNKEELISGLLLPRPGPLASCPSAPCFYYDKPVVAAVNCGIPDESFSAKCGSSNDEPVDATQVHVDGTDDLVDTAVLSHVDGTESLSGIVPPSHVSDIVETSNYFPMSAEDETNTRLSNAYKPGSLGLCPSAPCFYYDKPVVAAVNSGIPDASFYAMCGSSNDEPVVAPQVHVDGTDDLAATAVPSHVDGTESLSSIVPPSHVNDFVETSNYVPMSPEDETNTRLSNADKPEQSLGRIQRSRSRQKALELRNSAKANVRSRLGMDSAEANGKSRLGMEDYAGYLSFTNTGHDEQLDGLKESFNLAEPSALPNEICVNEVLALENSSNEENCADPCADSLAQSTASKGKEVRLGDSEMRTNSIVYRSLFPGTISSIQHHHDGLNSYHNLEELSTIRISHHSDALFSSGAKDIVPSICSSPNKEHASTPVLQHDKEEVSYPRTVMSFTSESHQASEPDASNMNQSVIAKPSESLTVNVEETTYEPSVAYCNGRMSDGLQKDQDVVNVSTAMKLMDNHMAVDQIKSSLRVDESDLSIGSPLMEHMDVEDDETMPEFEGFVIGQNTNYVPNCTAELASEDFSFLGNIMDRTSLPATACNSENLRTPVSPLPSACKVYFAPGIYSSVPNGHLESIDLRGSLVHSRNALVGKSHSDILPYPGSQYGWDMKKPFPSPVGKGFEGFVIGKKADDVPNCTAELASEDFSFLGNIMDRTSLPGKVCNSENLRTPVSPFPSACKVYFAPGIYSSVPNGQLENIDRRGSLVHSGNTFVGKSHSDILPFSDSHYGWDMKKPFRSPVGKGFEGITSKSGGSDKPGSSTLDLTCFPIMEDHESSEDGVNDTANGVHEDKGDDTVNTDAIERECSETVSSGVKEKDSSMRISGNKEPLHDATLQQYISLDLDPSVMRCSPGSVSTDYDIHKMNSNVKKSGMGKRSTRHTRPGKENKDFSIGTNSIKKHAKAQSSRFSKLQLSAKSNLRNRGQSMSAKEHKPNNIVSNVKSFLPLVKQKQAAAVVPEKRDVKVKALQAAEAAKRAAEKRENERRQKKEAMKLERARVEQQNIREMQLKKKLKEEERKKREAENAIKKRLREEEEKQEKERKKKRIEDARLQHKQLEQKLHVWREESRCGSEDGRPHQKKDYNERTARQVDRGNEGNNTGLHIYSSVVAGDDKRGTDDRPTTVIDQNSNEYFATEKEGNVDYAESSTPYLDKNEKPINRSNAQESYDISPYQCSDEEEEDDEIPNKKFIPAWASKNSVALALSSLQHIDPEEIFPPGSFCSLDEGLEKGSFPVDPSHFSWKKASRTQYFE